MADRESKRRERSRPTKDRVLQARIPRHLDEELRGHAEQLGLSVSTVVRNVLLNTFQLVEGVVADSARVARVAQGARPFAPSAETQDPPGRSRVVGWQEAVLNLNGICEHCNDILLKGSRAAVGLPVQARPVLLCAACLSDLAAAATATGEGRE
jgi:hypothetical protein